MKILYLYNQGIITPDLAISLMYAGHEVITVDDFECSYKLDDVICQKRIEEVLCQNHFDCVMSFNFIPSASVICSKYHIIYVSYMYDAWQPALYTPCAGLPYNRIFVFDSDEFRYLKKRQYKNIYFLPLAVNAERINQTFEITEEDAKAYTCDISFVGRLYCSSEVNAYSGMCHQLPSALQQQIENIITSTAGNWTTQPSLKAKLSEIDYSTIPVVHTAIRRDQCLLEDSLYYMAQWFAKPITQKDRTLILNILAKDYHTVIYTYEKPEGLIPEVTVKPGIDYISQMPKAFYYSKINLNITLRSISAGIPLRFFDVLGCCGFLMTNRQKDMLPDFSEDTDYVAFDSIKELQNKAAYYLNCREERDRIRINGYNKVCKYHTYLKRLDEIFRIINMS